MSGSSEPPWAAPFRGLRCAAPCLAEAFVCSRIPPSRRPTTVGRCREAFRSSEVSWAVVVISFLIDVGFHGPGDRLFAAFDNAAPFFRTGPQNCTPGDGVLTARLASVRSRREPKPAEPSNTRSDEPALTRPIPMGSPRLNIAKPNR